MLFHYEDAQYTILIENEMNRKVSPVPGLLCCLIYSSFIYSASIEPDITVAPDGSGNYRKVQDAINAAKSNGAVIFITPGTYKEKIKVPSNKKNLKLLGESYETTIITFNADASSGRNTHASATISGEDFYAENVTFQNTVDSRVSGSQAEALRVESDRAVFYRCRIMGFQDTYRHTGNKRSYHKECIIVGTTDFIYGDGIALFEDCTIYNRKNSHVTAHSQSLINGKPANKFGYVFMNCEIKKHPDETVTNASLGRPWGNAARVVYLDCYIGSHIRSAGWMEWNNNTNHLTAYYAEYKSIGPGANPEQRLSWTHQLTDAEAADYTKENIFKANTTTATMLIGDWNPIVEDPTGIRKSPPDVPETARQSIRINPYSPSTITCNFSHATPVRLSIYDLHGRVAAVPLDGTIPAGLHRASGMTRTFSRGVYIQEISIKSGEGKQPEVYRMKTIHLH